MRLIRHFLGPTLAVAVLATACKDHGDSGSQTYTVPKEQAAPAQAPAAAPGMGSAMPASDIPVSSANIAWTTPATWQELAPTSIRIGNFVIHGKGEAKAEVAIFSFPGTVGTELDNVNRWRNELKLAPITDDQIVSEPVTIDAIEGKLYRISSDTGRIVVASLPRDGSTWFFKMFGDKPTVTSAEPVYMDFLKTVHFNGAGGAAPHLNATDSAPVNPHGDLTGGAPAETAGDAPNGAPKFTVPSNWTETPAGQMLLKSYNVSNTHGAARVTISTFPGDVGGTFANVNRWRAQMGLAPIDESELGSTTQVLETPNQKATLVDFTGTDAKTGQPGRLVAVMVPHGDSTWFYKLMGDGPVVEAEKDTFVKFVQSVSYP